MKVKPVLLALGLLFVASSSFANTEATVKATTTSTHFTPEQMASAQKISMPNENHQVLNALAGEWNQTTSMWMAPGAAPEVASGSMTAQWILGGRFLQQEFKGEMMGQPFEGFGLLGYDNVKKEYTSVWVDNISTGIMTSTGQYDAGTKTLSESGLASCPMTGETNKQFRSEWKIVDADHLSYEMYTKGPDGVEFKTLTVSYTRK